MSTPILVRATHEQYLVSVGRQLSEWGQDFTLEQFTRRELLLKSTPFGQTLQCWVLAPSADPTTRDFFCSCETFRRPVLLSSGARKVCYSNAGVFTPIENRRKGYARQMMDELNRAVRVGAGDEGADWGEGEGAWQGGNDAVCSVLYSDVGDYYAKSGWDLVGPIQTTWKLDQLPPSAFTASTSLLPIPYDLATFASIAQADSLLVASSLPPTPASFAIEPLGSSCEWRIERARFNRSEHGLPTPSTWGFEYPGTPRGEDFVTFTINYPKSTLKILRIRTTGPDAGTRARELLRACFGEAKKAGCEKVSGWNLGSEVLSAMAAVGDRGEEAGETAARDDSMSAVAWFGKEGEVQWVANEGYAWC